MEDRLGKLRIEIVDDQALVRSALARLLETAEGLEVIATSSCASEVAREGQPEPPQLVLLDVPAEQSIGDAVREVLERCPRAIVVVLDDTPSDANVREMLRTAAAGYLTKDQPFSQINAALRKASQGERVFTPTVARRLTLTAEGVRLAAEDREHPFASLTPRETDVLINLAKGNSVKQCAKTLGIGASTVGNHKSRLMKKLNVHKTVELVHLAMREGLVPGPATARRHDLSPHHTPSSSRQLTAE